MPSRCSNVWTRQCRHYVATLLKQPKEIRSRRKRARHSSLFGCRVHPRLMHTMQASKRAPCDGVAKRLAIRRLTKSRRTQRVRPAQLTRRTNERVPDYLRPPRSWKMSASGRSPACIACHNSISFGRHSAIQSHTSRSYRPSRTPASRSPVSIA